MLRTALLLQGMKSRGGRECRLCDSGDWELQGQPSQHPKFQTSLHRLRCSQLNRVSSGMCHEQPCPSSSSTPQRPHTVPQGGLFSSVMWSESHRHPCVVGRMGTMIMPSSDEEETGSQRGSGCISWNPKRSPRPF